MVQSYDYILEKSPKMKKVTTKKGERKENLERKRQKFLVINLTRNFQDLYEENYNTILEVTNIY